ncbi:protein-disulfide reductase DsbD domain-containing protein [Oceanicola sp. 502str15]|uniref:protein-disulfide reductase DsbD domain-containing protein n=1 Tax=Oceanicola sp. 502str15 TaxID=2696061 RepID=UPI0020954745|nr:protein-disulfide reductase DsbD domain-containing protein [Oceanicola sp. 502str15]MCO6384379.1 hypothetical protein [Oceanicola sp. 502str15]
MKALFAALLTLALCTPVSAGTFGATPGEVVRAEVLPGWTTKRGTRMAALRLTLAPGWKTYWRAPGESGIPPSFDWSASRNLARVTLHWPSPQIFDDGGLRTIGYKRELVLPIEITPANPGAPVELAAKVDLGVCEHICVPASLAFTATLSGGGAHDPTIQAALKARPLTAREAGVSGVTCAVDPISDGVRVTARIPASAAGGRSVAVIEPGNPRIWASETETRREGAALLATADLVPPSGQAMALSRKALRVTLLGQGRAIDIQGCPAP